jgi:soluble lytic murein transglycosylase-like protein
MRAAGTRIGLWAIAATVITLAMSAPADAQTAPKGTDLIAAHVAEAAGRFGIPASWIWAVMRVESGGDATAVSPRGALGLMQIMPATWADLRTRYGLGADPFDAHDNIVAGAAFLREMYDRFGAPGFLGAYNAGPQRFQDHLATGHPLPAETQRYVTILAPKIAGALPVRGAFTAPDPLAWRRAPVFVVRADGGSATPQLGHDRPRNPLFVGQTGRGSS